MRAMSVIGWSECLRGSQDAGVLLRTRVNKERNPSSRQRAVRIRRCRHQVRGVGIGEELGHDGGLGDDLAVVRK